MLDSSCKHSFKIYEDEREEGRGVCPVIAPLWYHSPVVQREGGSYHSPVVQREGGSYNSPVVQRKGGSYHSPVVQREGSPYHSPVVQREGGSYHSPVVQREGGSYHSPVAQREGGSYHSPVVQREGGSGLVKSMFYCCARISRCDPITHGNKQSLLDLEITFKCTSTCISTMRVLTRIQPGFVSMCECPQPEL